MLDGPDGNSPDCMPPFHSWAAGTVRLFGVGEAKAPTSRVYREDVETRQC